MSTTVSRPHGRDVWHRVPATWGAYLGLLRARGERAEPRYTYIGGRLTIVSPGRSHEALKKRLGFLIEEMFLSLMIPFEPCGSSTLLKTVRPRTGTEGDESYYLTDIDRIRGKNDLVMGEDPPPDLMVEVVVSHPVADALAVYRGLGVREVWVCKRSEVVFLVLGENGRYAPSPTSACLPFLASEELTPWAYRQDLSSEAEVRHLFRRWVTDVLAPRHRPPEEGIAKAEPDKGGA